jgi:two-component sensor histidine kinase
VQRELANGAKRQEVMLNELQHRVRNMLTTIRALAKRTIANSTHLDEFGVKFESRLAVLTRAHELLNRSDAGAINLREVLLQELSAQGAIPKDNLHLDGPEILLGPRQAELSSMMFHELTTNAVKHGALSVHDGYIDISWQIENSKQESLIRLCWRERGVVIKDPPTRRGFGTEILEQSVPYMLGGTFDRVFNPDGVECVIRFPVSSALSSHDRSR